MIFAIVGALILPRLKDISAFITQRDVAGLSKELEDIKRCIKRLSLNLRVFMKFSVCSKDSTPA